MVIHDCTLHQKDGRRWVGLPGRLQLDAEKRVVVKDGRTQYARVLEFPDRDASAAFNRSALAALDRYSGEPTAAPRSSREAADMAGRPLDDPLPF